MGTRGAYGFRKDGKLKVTYNHFDSYPDWLGASIAEFIKSTSYDEIVEIYDRLVMVDEMSKPTAEQIEACKGYTNLHVGNANSEDWYCLLRESQGDLSAYKGDDALIYMIDNASFLDDTLFCEYAYIIDLDDGTLEFRVSYCGIICKYQLSEIASGLDVVMEMETLESGANS